MPRPIDLDEPDDGVFVDSTRVGIEAWIISDLGDLTFEQALEELGGSDTDN